MVPKGDTMTEKVNIEELFTELNSLIEEITDKEFYYKL